MADTHVTHEIHFSSHASNEFIWDALFEKMTVQMFYAAFKLM